MINRIKSWFQRPEKGWDPVPSEYAKKYSERCYAEDISDACVEIKDFFRDVRDKKVLDLGAGPGQFTCFFAEQGADITWHDVSKNYYDIFCKKYPDLNVKTVLSYIDDISGSYDFVFNRVCWYYSMNDKSFLRAIYRAMKPGAKGYFIIPNEGYLASLSQVGLGRAIRLIQFYLNNSWGIKIGHPMNTTKRIRKLFRHYPWGTLDINVDGRETIVKCQKQK